MAQDSFQQVCDGLSKIVDEGHFERFRWDRDEAPKLKRLVELVHAAFEERRDFDMAEEGATAELKRFVIKIHGKRTIAVAISYENGQAVFRADSVDRSAYKAVPGDPITTAYENVDEDWIKQALQAVFSRIRTAGSSDSSQQEAA